MRRTVMAVAAFLVAAAVGLSGCKNSSAASTNKPHTPTVSGSTSTGGSTSKGGGGWA